jgi:hypothetical protein
MGYFGWIDSELMLSCINLQGLELRGDWCLFYYYQKNTKYKKTNWVGKKYILTDCYEYVLRKPAEILMVQPHPSVCRLAVARAQR